ncbi:hypothetical protein HAX54_040901 [Datura stramonium]|uniref:Uncharacterized protein n=1 Tax=Datura stramonium TaxID=4076 RepID=A0ABS8VPL6_DATST|nr:hypothetical protein [Datura stramonium]
MKRFDWYDVHFRRMEEVNYSLLDFSLSGSKRLSVIKRHVKSLEFQKSNYLIQELVLGKAAADFRAGNTD